jgi:hypothetical protein
MCGLIFDDTVVESEKRQTVIHELSHFDHVGINEASSGSVVGERDHGYGESNCHKLAVDNPVTAMNNADNVGYYVRDIGTGSDPDCKNNYAQCDSWVGSHGCNSGATVGGQTLPTVCQLACKVCTPSTIVFADGTSIRAADSLAMNTPAPTPVPTPAPTPVPTKNIEQVLTVTGLSEAAYTGSVKSVYETAYAISLGLYDETLSQMKPGCVVTSTAMAPVADAPTAKVQGKTGTPASDKAPLAFDDTSEMLGMPPTPEESLLELSATVAEQEAMPPTVPTALMPPTANSEHMPPRAMPRMPPVTETSQAETDLQLLEASATPNSAVSIDFKASTQDGAAVAKAQDLTALTFATSVATSNSISQANVVVPTQSTISVASPKTSEPAPPPPQNAAPKQAPGVTVALAAVLAVAAALR